MKNYTISNLRAIAIILVVLGHSCIIYSPSWTVFSTDVESLFFRFIKEHIINAFHMTTFFAISGFLYYYTVINPKKTFKDVMWKKVIRVLVPYFMIAFFWMNPIKFTLGVYDLNSFSDIVLGQLYFSGIGIGHLWFLPAIFILFFAMYYPLKNCNTFKKALLLFVLVWAIAFLAKIVGIYDSRFIQIGRAIRFLPYFYLGFMMHYIPDYNKKVWAIISVLAIIITVLFIRIRTPFIVISILAVMKSLPNVKNNILEVISVNSFGIYLFHSPLVYITYTYWKDYNPLFVVGMNFLVFGSIALLLTILIRKVPKLRFIIGE